MRPVLEAFSSREVSGHFEQYLDLAISRPMAIERDGSASVVMLSIAEYARLLQFDHVALDVDELGVDAIEAIRIADPVPGSFEANTLLE